MWLRVGGMQASSMELIGWAEEKGRHRIYHQNPEQGDIRSWLWDLILWTSIGANLMGIIKSHEIPILSHWPALRLHSLVLLQALHVRRHSVPGPCLFWTTLTASPEERNEGKWHQNGPCILFCYFIGSLKQQDEEEHGRLTDVSPLNTIRCVPF